MAACRSICLPKCRKIFFRSSKFYSTSTNVKSESNVNENEIIVPYRIKRGPTDLLKALSSTVSKDFTAPHYKYEDDPYFIPCSNVTKRSFALSKESGKKAARYFLEKYPELFVVHTSEPQIKAFDPPVVYSEDDDLKPETLRECVQNFDVENSVKVFKILKKKDISISQELKQDLLELLCFYNSSQPLSEDFYEERFYQKVDEFQREKWNARGMAEELFQEMEKDGKAYSAMIAGASKFLGAERAFALYEEMMHKQLKCSLEAYNGLIVSIPFIKESNETRWEYTSSLLHSMKNEGLVPDIYTMNAVLNVLSKCRRWKKTKNLSLNVLAEMKKLNIDPSLGTYYYVLTIFNAYDSKDPSILNAIIDNIERKELIIQHPSDVLFFSTAMESCWKINQDKLLAYRINDLLELKDNCKLLGNSLSSSIYFKCFFRLLCEVEDIDKLMAVYEKYVPNTYTPEPVVTYDVIQAIHFNGSYKYLPRMCSDVLLFEQTERENVLNLLMEAAGCMQNEKQIQADLVNMVWRIFDKLTLRSEAGKLLLNWSGSLLGNMLKIFLNGDDIGKSWSIMEKLINEEQSIVGYPEKEILLHFCQLHLTAEEYKNVSLCIKYAINGAYPDFIEDFRELTKDMYQKELIGEKQRVHIDGIFSRYSISNDLQTSSSDSSSDEYSSSDDEKPTDSSTSVKS